MMRALGISVVLIGTLVLVGCGGGGGGSNGGGGPQGTLTLSPTTLTFTASNLVQTPASQDVNATLNTNASGTVFLRIVSTGPAVAGISNILITSDTTGRGTVVPAAPATLGPGSHSSTVTVTACTSGPTCPSGIIGSPQTVAVTYNVTGITSPLSGVTYTLSMAPAAADYTRTLPLVAYPTYSASSNVSWLSISPMTGGSGTTNLTLNLVQSAVNAFESGDHTATLLLSAPGNNLLVPVTLTVTKPQIDQVAPYVAEANKPATVIVRGLYLDQLPANSIDLSATANGSGIAPTNVTVVSPTEVRLTHPALSAGSYFVRMHDAQGALIERSTARLVVVEPTSYPAETLSWPADMKLRNVQSLVYDDERKTLLMAVLYGGEGFASSELYRFQYTTSWSTPLITPFPHLDRLALSADGRDLLAASSPPLGIDYSPKLSVMSPTSLLERAGLQTQDGGTFFSGLAVLNTNVVIAQGDSHHLSSSGWPSYRYSVKSNTFTPLTFEDPSLFFSGFVRGTIVTSRDGKRVVAASEAGSSANQQIFDYDSGSSDLRMRLAPFRYDVRAMSLDRTGDKLLVRGHDLSSEFLRVYDRSWNLLGTLSVMVGDHYILAPDGTRAYIYGYDGDVHIYDLTAPPVAGEFQETGTLSLAGLPDSGTNLMRMTISQDGHTLFMAGITQVVVQPLP
jgi:hypothetical protein